MITKPDEFQSPKDVRMACRLGKHTSATFGCAPGYLQANLVILPEKYAEDFKGFCLSNPKPCPLLVITEPGAFHLQDLAKDVDLRIDLPKYNVFQDGAIIDEPTEINKWWRDDLVTFLLGCSFSFEYKMIKAGFPVRHVEEDKNVPMYKTNIECFQYGVFAGNLVVSMRPLKLGSLAKVTDITSRYTFAHGAPIHHGDTEGIGIKNISNPDFGDKVSIYPEEIPVFWACGVTPQLAIMQSKIEFAITHSPGCMFVSDIKADKFVWKYSKYNRN